MRFKHYWRSGIEWNALVAGEIVATDFKHYAMYSMGMMYVSEKRPPYRFKTLEDNRQWMKNNAKQMTIDCYIHFYGEFGNVERAAAGKGWPDDSFDQRSVW